VSASHQNTSSRRVSGRLAQWTATGRACLLILLGALLPANSSWADEVAFGTLVRADTDHTLVVTPRARIRAPFSGGRSHVDAAYAADIWSSASIDVRTAATSRVSEQRDELDLGVDREFDDLTLRMSYRFSNEVDYQAQGVGLGAALDLAEGSATVSLDLRAGFDRIGRSGDTRLRERQRSLAARLSYEQAIDRDTLLQLVYEGTRVMGFQSSPYRFIGIGGSCQTGAALCIPEQHPRLRMRHAFVARARRALGDSASVGLDYRLYVDGWGMVGNTFGLRAAWLPNDKTTLTLRYRGHRQNAARFYQSTYEIADLDTQSFFTRDRELGALWSQRLAFDLEREFDVGSAGAPLLLSFALGATYYSYDDFTGLDSVGSLDFTVSALWQM